MRDQTCMATADCIWCKWGEVLFQTDEFKRLEDGHYVAQPKHIMKKCFETGLYLTVRKNVDLSIFFLTVTDDTKSNR